MILTPRSGIEPQEERYIAMQPILAVALTPDQSQSRLALAVTGRDSGHAR